MKRLSILVTALALTLGVGFSASVFAAAQARIVGKIVDSAGKPIPNAKIVITNPKVPAFKKEEQAGKDGVFKTLLLDSTYAYDYEISAPGYVTRTYTNYKASIGSVQEWEFQLLDEKENQQQAMDQAEIPATDQAKILYNDAVTAVNAKDYATAKPKLLEAVGKDPKLKDAWKALAMVAVAEKDGKAAVENAQKAIELEEKEMADEKAMGDEVDEADLAPYLSLLLKGQELAKDKEGAEKTRARLALAAGDPAPLYNDGVAAFNNNQMDLAEKKLGEALKRKEDFAPAHYLLGVVKMNQGKNAEAKAHFQRYLELSPDGKEADEVKAFLSYL